MQDYQVAQTIRASGKAQKWTLRTPSQKSESKTETKRQVQGQAPANDAPPTTSPLSENEIKLLKCLGHGSGATVNVATHACEFKDNKQTEEIMNCLLSAKLIKKSQIGGRVLWLATEEGKIRGQGKAKESTPSSSSQTQSQAQPAPQVKIADPETVIYEHLSLNPNLDAASIAQDLHLPLKLVNGVLYSLLKDSQVEKTMTIPPVWWVVEVDESAEPSQ